MIIKNLTNGTLLENVKLTPTEKVPLTNANESEVEAVFDIYLKNIGYDLGGLYTKRTARGQQNPFPSKTGSQAGYPDYVFYESPGSDKIIAIGDLKRPDSRGTDNSIVGLRECTDIYLHEYNKRHADKVKIAFGYDGFNFVIKHLNESTNLWEDIKVDNEPLTVMPEHMLLNSIALNGGYFSTQVEKNISKELLEPYFAQCDNVFRQSQSSLSAVDKASEISIFIFLKIFSNDKLDTSFKSTTKHSVWEYIENGSVDMVNTLFRDFLNLKYQNVFPQKLIKIGEQSAKDLARIINSMFLKCKIDRMTDVKGNALEYYQKDSKDRKIGEFFTPRHLIDLIVTLTRPQIAFKKSNNQHLIDANGNSTIESIDKIYDPACGSGGFLIQSFLYYLEKYKQYGVSQKDLKTNVVFGNELKDGTVMLTKLNMILLGDGHNHISNENALGYKKISKLEKTKDANGKYIVVDKKNVSYRDEFINSEKISFAYDITDGGYVIEQISNVKYCLLTNNLKNGKLVKAKDDDNHDIFISSDNVKVDSNIDGTKSYFTIDTNQPVRMTGTGNTIYYKATIKLKPDGITPMDEYIDIRAVNEKVRSYHSEFFGLFDIVMANHPYGLEEPSKPDELFIRHMIDSAKSGGKIACIVGEKILFDDNYTIFREHLLNSITIEGIISLPQGVFNPYTDVKTSILLLKKEKPLAGHKTWLAEIQSDGFDLNLSRAPLNNNDIPKILRLWDEWGGRLDGAGNYHSFHREEIGFAEFHNLTKRNWCVKRYNTPLVSLKSKHKLIPIQNLFIRAKNEICIQDDVEYKQVTIQHKNKGLILRDTLLGKDIGTKKQYVIKAGQFLISKIDARNGSYGIVPKELDGAIITANFWTFDINTNYIIPEFLSFIAYLLRSDFFKLMCNVCSYGSTNRWYLDEEQFKEFCIPIPEPDEQQAICNLIKANVASILNAQITIQIETDNIMGIVNNVLC